MLPSVRTACSKLK